MTKKRKFGEIPEHIKRAAVTLSNYDLKAEYHGAKIAMYSDDKPWPYLTNQNGMYESAEREAWEDYFWKRLGGFPYSYKLFREGVMQHYNLPAVTPEEFDLGWVRP